MAKGKVHPIENIIPKVLNSGTNLVYTDGERKPRTHDCADPLCDGVTPHKKYKPNRKGKKTQKPKDLLRQKALAKTILTSDNPRKSRKQAMLDAGYSPSYAASSEIKKTRTWTELMNEYMPEDLLARTHNELLGASHINHYDFPESKKDTQLTDEEIKAVVESVPGCKLIYVKSYGHGNGSKTAYFSSPDSKIRKDAIDLAYKNRGLYAAEKVVVETKLKKMTNKELADHIAKQKNFFKKK